MITPIIPITLPYRYDALEPYYGEETLRIHYEELYKGYVKNLNTIERKLEEARLENNFDNIKCLEKDLSYNGSGVILHELFFTNMSPPQIKSEPDNKLMTQIIKDFGSFDAFKAQFEAASKSVEASRLVCSSMGS